MTIGIELEDVALPPGAGIHDASSETERRSMYLEGQNYPTEIEGNLNLGSINRYGGEWVSPILKTEEEARVWLRERVGSTPECYDEENKLRSSIHIHVGVPQEAWLIHTELSQWLEPLTFAISCWGGENRGEHNHYAFCRPLDNPQVVRVRGVGHIPAFSIERVLESSSYNEFHRRCGYTGGRYYPARYTSINLTSIPKRGTVEFRTANYSRSFRSVFRYTILLHRVVNYVTGLYYMEKALQLPCPPSDVRGVFNEIMSWIGDKELEPLELFIDKWDGRLPKRQWVATHLQDVSYDNDWCSNLFGNTWREALVEPDVRANPLTYRNFRGFEVQEQDNDGYDEDYEEEEDNTDEDPFVSGTPTPLDMEELGRIIADPVGARSRSYISGTTNSAQLEFEPTPLPDPLYRELLPRLPGENSVDWSSRNVNHWMEQQRQREEEIRREAAGVTYATPQERLPRLEGEGYASWVERYTTSVVERLDRRGNNV